MFYTDSGLLLTGSSIILIQVYEATFLIGLHPSPPKKKKKSPSPHLLPEENSGYVTELYFSKNVSFQEFKVTN